MTNVFLVAGLYIFELNLSLTVTHSYRLFSLMDGFELGRSLKMLGAVVYRPPRYNKDFINDFSAFLADIMPKYDHVLIVGGF